MTIKEIDERVAMIDRIKDDDESAHSHEDELYSDFISHVSQSEDKKLAKMALAVLKTKTIEFSRWCA